MKQELFKALKRMSAEEVYDNMFVDPLTGCLNRRAFDGQQRTPEVVAIVDLDSLKYVNDSMGHREGDKFLTWLGTMLCGHAGQDNVYRMGGDEFVVTGESHTTLLNALTTFQCVFKTFSFGVGCDLAEADAALLLNKATREQSGARASRGCKPPWLETETSNRGQL